MTERIANYIVQIRGPMIGRDRWLKELPVAIFIYAADSYVRQTGNNKFR